MQRRMRIEIESSFIERTTLKISVIKKRREIRGLEGGGLWLKLSSGLAEDKYVASTRPKH